MVDCNTPYTGICASAFIDCTSLSISFNVMGQATISYVMVHKENKLCYKDPSNFIVSGRIFCGYIMSMSMTQIPDTVWYETNVTMIATTTN